jgi:hypothetical protein
MGIQRETQDAVLVVDRLHLLENVNAVVVAVKHRFMAAIRRLSVKV